jgi:hypothetical protein
MRVFSLFALMMFSSTTLAADFQLPDLALGSAKAEIKPEILNKTTVQLFQTDAKVEIQWAEDKIAALQLTFYQDADYEVLRQKTSSLLTQVSYQFGAVNWVSAEAGATSEQTLEQQLSLLDQVLKTAPQAAATYKQSHLANATMVLDFQPSPQPDNSRLHIQASYSALSNSYSLKLFIDEKTAAERTGFAIVNLEAF